MLRNKILPLILLSLWFWSCKKTTENPNRVIWGETEYYNNFLIKKYEPVIMTQTLELKFSDDAKRLLNSDIKFEAVERNEQDKFVKVKGIKLYKNRILCADGILRINSKEKEQNIELGIEFTEDAKEGNHTLYLQVIDGGGLDRIDDTDLSADDEIILAHEWVVKKNDVYNPLAKLLFWVGVAIIVILIACFIVSRITNPSTKFSKLYIDYHDGSGEKRIRMGSGYKLLCTNKKTRFSILYKFFVGVVKVEVNDFWEHPLTMKSGRRDSIRISGLGEYSLDEEETIRKEPFTITNNSGQKVTITTA